MRPLLFPLVTCALSACQAGGDAKITVDLIITNGKVFVGDNAPAQDLYVAIKNDRIVYVGDTKDLLIGKTEIDAAGLYVVPGFIDPHTHSLGELQSDEKSKRTNLNYLTQGVTTVVNGNDGFGDPDIETLAGQLEQAQIGTNTALFIGHGALREKIMGREKRAPSTDELAAMENAIGSGMEAGALGLSTGLFYAPGSFSDTEEVIALSKIASKHGGVYDSHIRDEATYNIGLEAAIDEVLQIAKQADIHVNISHIKALGVDAWGKSEPVIQMIESAQASGLSVSADQYPWQASGTRISNALLPRWVKAGSKAEYMARLDDPNLLPKIISETRENLRKRGGPSAVLITQDKNGWQNKTLEQIADENGLSAVDMAIEIARQDDARIASFNMNSDDIENFMRQPWVMTSSDGSTGHPRKYASYPQKYSQYVIKKNLMPIETFFYRSSGMVADNFNICDRGYIREGYFADIAIIDPKSYAAKANFQNPEVLSVGVTHVLVNGVSIIKDSELQPELPGTFVPRCEQEKTNVK